RLDRLTGRNRWKVSRPRAINWVTPLLIHNQGKAEVLFQTASELTAYNQATGQQRWTFDGKGLFPDPCAPSPAAGDGLILLACGLALRPKAEGAVPEVVWKQRRLRPAYASPLYYQGPIYAINNSSLPLHGFCGKE